MSELWFYAKELLERYTGDDAQQPPSALTRPAVVRELEVVACYLRRRQAFADRKVKNTAAVLEGIALLLERLKAAAPAPVADVTG